MFKQEPWLEKYILSDARRRKESTTKFQRNYFKLMISNSKIFTAYLLQTALEIKLKINSAIDDDLLKRWT